MVGVDGRRRALLGALAALVFAVPARAAGVSNADAQRVRRVIEAQLAAFASDDAKRAFSFAAPSIRRQFGSPERFITMVRLAYPVVYRPATISFLKPEAHRGVVIQAVEMTDADGAVWIAVYHLERQRDRQWRISGCELAASDARSA